MVEFVANACQGEGLACQKQNKTQYALLDAKGDFQALFTTDRDEANENEGFNLVGLDHPLIEKLLNQARQLSPEEIGLVATSSDGQRGVVSVWAVETNNEKGQVQHRIIKLAVDEDGKRVPSWEKQMGQFYRASHEDRSNDIQISLSSVEPMLERELGHRGIIKDHQPYSAGLIGWINVV